MGSSARQPTSAEAAEDCQYAGTPASGTKLGGNAEHVVQWFPPPSWVLSIRPDALRDPCLRQKAGAGRPALSCTADLEDDSHTPALRLTRLC